MHMPDAPAEDDAHAADPARQIGNDLSLVGSGSNAVITKLRKMDERAVRQMLTLCWSRSSSSLWSEDNPARGQCGVTALVVQDRFGGELLKTPVDGRWHFYNRVGGVRYDFTAEQFRTLPEYLDLAAGREEAFADTDEGQYSYLSRTFDEAERVFHAGADRQS